MKVNEEYSLAVNTEINAENIRRALKVLIDNGIDPDEAGGCLGRHRMHAHFYRHWILQLVSN